MSEDEVKTVWTPNTVTGGQGVQSSTPVQPQTTTASIPTCTPVAQQTVTVSPSSISDGSSALVLKSETTEKLSEAYNQTDAASQASNIFRSAIAHAAVKSETVKDSLDLGITAVTVAQKEVMEELVGHKEDELIADARAKAIASETAKIREEVEKAKKRGELELSELQNSINKLKQEKAELDAETNKCEAYFGAHPELKYVGKRKPSTMKSMKFWIIPAGIIEFLLLVVFFPVTLVGCLFEKIIEIANAVAEEITHKKWKIVLATLTIIIVVALVSLVYYAFAYWVFK